MVETKDLAGAKSKPRKRREQNDRAIRGILGTLNKKLKQSDLGEQDFARYVELAIQLRKTIGKAPSLKDRQSAERPSKQDLF